METDPSSDDSRSRRGHRGLRYTCGRCGTEYGGMRARCPYCGEGNHRHPVVIALSVAAVIAAIAVVIFVLRRNQLEKRDEAVRPFEMPERGTEPMR